ncbi:unnamed protein product [Leptidea sinapis]|uniref:Uncharacterized protein n=1 Tax=Leptidea sinapis TaxID=189913 RepID=A0A5E4QM53_9NEOP|nr:unnamed protein product [Leptidea sinapis]
MDHTNGIMKLGTVLQRRKKALLRTLVIQSKRLNLSRDSINTQLQMDSCNTSPMRMDSNHVVLIYQHCHQYQKISRELWTIWQLYPPQHLS